MGADTSDPKAVEVVHDYVSKSRSWNRSDYRVEEKGREGNLIVYWIVHLDDERAPVPGGGKSLAVRYDSRKRQVVKELAFQ